nr:hypothetical protein [uncultured Gellertiella sp.]
MTVMTSHVGRTLEDFLDELGEKEEIYNEAIKPVSEIRLQMPQDAGSASVTASPVAGSGIRTSDRSDTDPGNALSLQA